MERERSIDNGSAAPEQLSIARVVFETQHVPVVARPPGVPPTAADGLVEPLQSKVASSQHGVSARRPVRQVRAHDALRLDLLELHEQLLEAVPTGFLAGDDAQVGIVDDVRQQPRPGVPFPSMRYLGWSEFEDY